MLKKRIACVAATIFASVICLLAQEGPKKPDPVEMAEKETERLETNLKLEDWQVFYVDSTLRNDFTQMFAELEKLQRARVENTDLYVAVQDKWVEATQNSYRRIFNDEQWAMYLKQGGQRIIKDREKRRSKVEAKKK